MTFSTRAICLALVTLALSCSARGAIELEPSQQEIQDIRATAVRVADAVKTALTIADEAGKLIATLPISPERKNAIDCAILRVTGPSGTATPATAAAVTKACGPINTGVLKRALEELPKIAARPQLTTTVQSIVEAIDPLILRLSESESGPLRALASVLQMAFSFVRGLAPALLASAWPPALAEVL